jgi:hypothetical protein
MIETMKQALEALEMLLTLDTHDEMHLLETDIAPKAITALRQAIEQAENQGLQKAAEQWHGLYLAKCRELHDERARLGQQICDLEHDLKENNHEAVKAERESCAKVCERLGTATNGTYERNAECAAAIRERDAT